MVLAMAGLIVIGITSIYASDNPAGSEPSGGLADWQKQILFTAVGIVALTAVNIASYRFLGSVSYWLYAVNLAALAVLLFSKYVYSLPFIQPVHGAYRWIQVNIAGHALTVQPSEFCKVTYILALAWYLRFKKNCSTFVGLLGPFMLTLLAMGLIILEPDLGMTMLMMPVLFIMLFVAGARAKHLILILIMAIMVSPLLWFQLKDYQKRRISSVLLQSEKVLDLVERKPFISKLLTGTEHFDIKSWNLDKGYQLKLSKLAIASGGIFGYGYRKGPYLEENNLKDLPERHNDFIFAIIAHQFGLFGCLVVLGLYGILIACAVEIAEHNNDPFAKLVTVGIIAMFAVQVIVNTSMTVGLMPITGLTLPFISAGGSSLMVSMLAVGILNCIGRTRPFTVAAKPFEKAQ
jgi:cell division protein FtsW (lipid II flippase)